MDMANTLRAVADASNLPLSLLIVGVGSEDFSAMEVGGWVGGCVCVWGGGGRGERHGRGGPEDGSSAAQAACVNIVVPCLCWTVVRSLLTTIQTKAVVALLSLSGQALDGDKKRIRGPDGRSAARDCVQFCELRPHQASARRGPEGHLSTACMDADSWHRARAPGAIIADLPPWLAPCPPTAHSSHPCLQRDTVEGLAAKLLAELPGQVRLEGSAALLCVCSGCF